MAFRVSEDHRVSSQRNTASVRPASIMPHPPPRRPHAHVDRFRRPTDRKDQPHSGNRTYRELIGSSATILPFRSSNQRAGASELFQVKGEDIPAVGEQKSAPSVSAIPGGKLGMDRFSRRLALLRLGRCCWSFVRRGPSQSRRWARADPA